MWDKGPQNKIDRGPCSALDGSNSDTLNTATMTKTTIHPLSKALDALGWTQGELSRRSGVAQSTISFALADKRGGKFSATSARKILDAIGSETWRGSVGGKQPKRGRAASRLTLSDLVFPRA